MHFPPTKIGRERLGKVDKDCASVNGWTRCNRWSERQLETPGTDGAGGHGAAGAPDAMSANASIYRFRSFSRNGRFVADVETTVMSPRAPTE